ncbi:MAG: hypothetical protein ACW97O_04810 [Candidatus Thorarchaeota archaeon]|jgi:hypothetical protein
MKVRNVLALMLSVMLLLTAGSGLAQGPQPTESSEAVDLSADLAASFPWFNIEVDTPGSVGQYTSIAIDPLTDTTYVSYYDATNKTLRLAMNRGFGSGGNCGPNNSWLCQTIDSSGDVGMYSSIAVNPSTGGIGIAYYDATNGQLKYAHGEICPTCVWSKDIIDKPILFPTDNKGQHASLKYHSNGRPYIAYYFENTSGVDALMVAGYLGSSGNCGYGTQAGKWQCITIMTGEGVGQYASLALDEVGHRHIAYYDGGTGDLWYATSGTPANCGPGNSWLCYPVSVANDVGQYASLYMDNSNHFHIAYYDATADELKYAVDVGGGGNCGVLGSAQCDTIDSMPADSHPLGVSIAEDKSYYPFIAYQAKNGSLNVARPVSALGLPGGSGNCGPGLSTWYCETVDAHNPWIPYRNGDFVSIAINPDGLATIAYFGFITATQGNMDVSYQRFHQIYLPLVMKNQ